MSQDSSFPLNPSESRSSTTSPVSTLRDISSQSPTFLPPHNDPEKPTLVFELVKVLISSINVQDHNNPPTRYDFTVSYEIDGHLMVHYVTKRPGLEDFLEKMSSMYELVIFTEANKEYASLAIDQIDPRGLISHRLYRDSCTENADGNYVKELSKIGREITRMIMIDNNLDEYVLFPENVIWVSEFIDDVEDDKLAILGEYLDECSDYEDMRVSVAEYA